MSYSFILLSKIFSTLTSRDWYELDDLKFLSDITLRETEKQTDFSILQYKTDKWPRVSFYFLYPKSQASYFLKCGFLILKFWYYVIINFELHHIVPELVT